MENKHNNQHGFGTGFILGLLVGIVATLFITTKKGREIFKELTERGMDKFSDLETKFHETTERFEKFDDEDEYVPVLEKPTEHTSEKSAEDKEHHHKERHTHEEHHEHKSSQPRRFFKSKKN